MKIVKVHEIQYKGFFKFFFESVLNKIFFRSLRSPELVA